MLDENGNPTDRMMLLQYDEKCNLKSFAPHDTPLKIDGKEFSMPESVLNMIHEHKNQLTQNHNVDQPSPSSELRTNSSSLGNNNALHQTPYNNTLNRRNSLGSVNSELEEPPLNRLNRSNSAPGRFGESFKPVIASEARQSSQQSQQNIDTPEILPEKQKPNYVPPPPSTPYPGTNLRSTSVNAHGDYYHKMLSKEQQQELLDLGKSAYGVMSEDIARDCINKEVNRLINEYGRDGSRGTIDQFVGHAFEQIQDGWNEKIEREQRNVNTLPLDHDAAHPSVMMNEQEVQKIPLVPPKNNATIKQKGVENCKNVMSELTEKIRERRALIDNPVLAKQNRITDYYSELSVTQQQELVHACKNAYGMRESTPDRSELRIRDYFNEAVKQSVEEYGTDKYKICKHIDITLSSIVHEANKEIESQRAQGKGNIVDNMKFHFEKLQGKKNGNNMATTSKFQSRKSISDEQKVVKQI
jgi:hypothetical protein